MTRTETPTALDWHRPAGSAGRERDPVVITPEDAGWAYCGLRVVEVAPGQARELATGLDEMAVLPLAGGGLRVEAEGRSFRLAGRHSVFARVTDWAYVPIDAEVRLSSDTGAEVALASARATRRFDPVRVDAGAVPIEVRGAGPATRQVTNFLAPDAFDGADRLMCVELLTPDGNWSSYPPHKHDGTDGCPVANEEIYYFRIGRAGHTGLEAPPTGGAVARSLQIDTSRTGSASNRYRSVGRAARSEAAGAECTATAGRADVPYPRTLYAAEGFALHRTYTADGAVDVNVAVRDGDVFLIPRGYHGPCIAAPGYPLYYLNVLAGPGSERTMAFCDDPTHHWVRASWEGMPPDPRCPMTSPEGVVGP